MITTDQYTITKNATVDFAPDERIVVKFTCPENDENVEDSWSRALNITEYMLHDLKCIINDGSKLAIILDGSLEVDNVYVEALCDRLWSLFYEFRERNVHLDTWIYIVTDNVSYALNYLCMHHLVYTTNNLHLVVGKDNPKRTYKRIGKNMFKEITDEIVKIN